MTEEWRPVVGYEGIFEVSDLGRVRSLDRMIRTKGEGRTLHRGRVLTDTAGTHGYRLVCLSVDKVQRSMSVHRLVLLAFRGPAPEGMVGCHGDGDPANNCLTNLRWASDSANAADRRAHGRDRNARKTHCPSNHEYTKENTMTRKNGDRVCRECSRIRSAVSYASRRAA